MQKLLDEAVAGYDFGGEVINCELFGEGHINDTFVVEVKISTDLQKRYILQRINTEVFKKPLEVMENILGVTEFLRVKIA